MSSNKSGNLFTDKPPIVNVNKPAVVAQPTPEDLVKAQAMQYYNMSLSAKPRSNGAGAVNKGAGRVQGMLDVSQMPSGGVYGSARGIREKIAQVNYAVLRQAAKKVGVISAIQNTRIMQIRPFGKIAYNDDDPGFRVKLKDKDGTPDNKDKKIMKEIQDFILHSGYTDFVGSGQREDKLPQILGMLTRDMMTFDQIALSIRKDISGRIIDYWALDGSTIKRTIPGRGYRGDRSILFVQEVQGKVVETFREGELIFYCHNRGTEIYNRGYGYSYIEQSIDLITAWLFAMAYNKEVFNSSAMPKGFLSFESEKLDTADLEELQREWIAMFRGVKGMWRTPFLQHGAKWNTMAPSNRDMEWTNYTQWLATWVCAIHGIDPAEFGVKLNGAQNVLNENQDKKISYSQDRGLKELVGFHETWINMIIEFFPEWEDYEGVFTGIEAKDQHSELEVDKLQTEVYMTVNEKRKEKDLPPIEGGDILLNPQYTAALEASKMAEQAEGMEGAPAEGGGEFTPEDEEIIANSTEEDIREAAESLKSFNDVEDYIEIEI
jgi:hypothetical protein